MLAYNTQCKQSFLHQTHDNENESHHQHTDNGIDDGNRQHQRLSLGLNTADQNDSGEVVWS